VVIKVEGYGRADFNFFTSVPTRWGDADMLGHINNVIFVRYLESGRLDYLDRVLGLKFKQPLGQGILIADMQVSYLSQVHHPTNLVVATRVSRVGNTSFDVLAKIYDEQGDVVVSSKAVCVWYNFALNQKQSVPLAAREAVFDLETIKPE
jgi:acyl-CoA thioester hydrolase